MKFNERFNIDMSQEQARLRFTNRIIGTLFPFFPNEKRALASTGTINRALGERNLNSTQIAQLIEDDFSRLLDMLERLRVCPSITSRFSPILVPTLLRGNAPWDAPASRMQRGSVAALRSHGGPWERARRGSYFWTDP